jgi:hypothetical protein
MPLPKDILAYHKALPAADRRVCDALADAIDAHFFGKEPLAGAECKVRHRHPVWFIDGNPIVGYHKLKGTKKTGGCIRLLFWSGQSFDEPADGTLQPDPPGTRFKTAAARFTSADEINPKDLKRWLKKSVEIQWDYKNIVKRKGRLERLN